MNGEARLRRQRLLPLIVRPGTGRHLEVHVTRIPPDFDLHSDSHPEVSFRATTSTPAILTASSRPDISIETQSIPLATQLTSIAYLTPTCPIERDVCSRLPKTYKSQSNPIWIYTYNVCRDAFAQLSSIMSSILIGLETTDPEVFSRGNERKVMRIYASSSL
jgi:hypothetical protein